MIFKYYIISCLLVSGLFCGCANIHFAKKNEPSAIAQSELKEKDRRIRELEELVIRKDDEIKERDCRIQQLKEKLRSLGIF